MTALATVAEDYRFVERGTYAVRADERWDVYCSFLPDGSGYHWLMACGHGMVTRSVNEVAVE